MKLLKYVFLIIITGCSVGVNKDMMTGLSVANKGLSVEESFLAVNDTRLSSAEVMMNTKVVLYIQGIGGFTEVDGMVFPGCRVQVFDKDDNAVLEADDVFADMTNGVTAEDGQNLSASVTVGYPMMVGEKYTWRTKFWDKKGEGVITAEVDITIVE